MVEAGCEVGTLCLWISIRQNPSQGHSLDRKCAVPDTRPLWTYLPPLMKDSASP